MGSFLKIGLFTTFLAISTHLAIAQNQINVLVLHDDGDMLAVQGVQSAVDFLAQNPGEGVSVNKKYMMAMRKETDIEVSVNATCDIMDSAIDDQEPPHIVLDMVKTGVTSETTKSFTRSLGLPTFSSSYGQRGDLQEWKDLTENEKKILVQVMPPGDIIVQSIRDIVRSENITNAAILFDDSFVMDHKYKSLLQNLPCRHIIVKAEDKPKALRTQMKKLKDASLVNYFVTGSIDTIREVLDAATANSMFGRKYSWFSLSKDLDDMGCGCENSTVIYMNPYSNGQIKSRLNLLKTSYGLNKLPEIDASFYFDFAMRGIKAAGALLSQGKYDNFNFLKCSAYDEANPPNREDFDLRTELEQVSVQNAWMQIEWGDNGMSFPEVNLAIETNMILGGKKANTKKIGQWKSGIPGQFMFAAGQNLRKHKAITVYTVVTILQPPFIMKRKDSNGKTEFYGYCIDLLNEIKKLTKFEFEIYETPDGKFGRLNENGEWDGAIKELLEKRADVALGSISVMSERGRVIDFTVPYYDLVGTTILMKKPKAPTSLFKFLTVLEPEVWICILAAYFFTSIVLWIFDRFSPYSYWNNHENYVDDDEKRDFNLKECLWFCMTSLTPQGGGEAPKNLSGRLVAATWWLFGFIIIASYTANLAAFLTVSRLDVPINSLTDLSNQYKVQYAPLNGSSTMTYFQRMSYIENRFYEIWKEMSLNDSMTPVERARLAVWDYPVSDRYTKIWQSMREAGIPQSYEEALLRVRSSKTANEGFAYIGDATDIRYQVLTNCDFQVIGREFSRKPYAIAVQKGSPLKDLFNDGLLMLLNERKLETLKERWWNKNPMRKPCIEENNKSDGISIENIGGVFIVIFFGIVVACITLAFEFWYYKYRNAKESRAAGSGAVVSVKELPDPKDSTFAAEKSNFNTEYRNTNYDIPSVPNPW